MTGEGDDDERRRVAGEVAVAVARELADPIRALRDRLGLVVDQLERHVATSTGPAPYPWRAVHTLRQDLAAAYLEATRLARRLDELDRALGDEAPGWFELPAAVDLGVRLAGPAAAADLELLIDLGHPPPARGVAGTLALVVAQLFAACARSARARAGSALSVRVSDDDGWALVTLADNGAGDPAAAALGDLARDLLASWGAQVDAASEPDQGCAFELRLVTSPR